jgi:hypothetical protein
MKQQTLSPTLKPALLYRLLYSFRTSNFGITFPLPYWERAGVRVYKTKFEVQMLCLTLLLGLLACQTTAYADPAIRQYNIPAGPMAAAVNQLAETGDIQAIYDT